MPETIPIRPDGLQIDEDRRFQHRFWRAQRAGWACFALITLVAVSGLTGRGGPFAQGETRLAGAEISWPRIARRGTSDRLTLRGTSATAPEVTLGPALTEAFEIETIQPRPAMESGAIPPRFAFFPDGTQPYAIHFDLRARRAGLVRYRVSFGGESVTLTTLILP